MNLPDSTPPAAPPASTLGPENSRLLAIGNFDGVHLGHRYLISQVVAEAASAGLAPAIMTFDPHPSEVLGRGRKATLTSLPMKLALLNELFPQLEVLVEPFTLGLAKLSPKEFALQLIHKHRAKHVLVGEDFRFGQGRSGSLETLRTLGQELGFSASAAELLTQEGSAISSSRIRRAIAAGELSKATELLGRRHRIGGVVVAGEQRGRKLGYPTANLAQVTELLPPNGVYSGYVRLGGKGYRAMANIGVRPTISTSPPALPSVEVHLLEFEGNLYDQHVSFELHELLREERKFESLEELQAQLERDARAVVLRLPEPVVPASSV